MNAPKTAENQLELEVLSLREANDRLRLKLKKCWEHSSRAARLSDPLVDFLTDDEGRVVHPGDQFDDGLSTEGLGLDDPDDPEDSDNDDRFGDGLSTEGLGLDDPRRRCHRGETNNTKWPAYCKARVKTTGRECTVLETWPVDLAPEHGIRASLELASGLDYDHELSKEELNCYVEFTDIVHEVPGEDGSLDGVFTFDQLELLGDDKDDKEDSDSAGYDHPAYRAEDPRVPSAFETNATKWPAAHPARVIATGRECTVLETWPLDWSNLKERAALNCYVEFVEWQDAAIGRHDHHGVFTFDQLEMLGEPAVEPVFGDGMSDKELRYMCAAVRMYFISIREQCESGRPRPVTVSAALTKLDDITALADKLENEAERRNVWKRARYEDLIQRDLDTGL